MYDIVSPYRSLRYNAHNKIKDEIWVVGRQYLTHNIYLGSRDIS